MAITTSPYINGPDILEHPTRTVKEVHLDFSSVADGCIKAGSPISAAGKVANDATAIGILLHDNYSDCGCGHGMVVVAGRIKADVAEQHSGITISPEAKGGMPCVAFVDAAGIVTGGGSVPGGSAPSGPVSWNDLTDKPFGEESVVFFEATEFTEKETNDGGYAKISDEPWTREKILGSTVTMYENGWKGEANTTDERDIQETENYIASGDSMCISVFNDCERYGTAFTRGLWVRWSENYYVGKIEKISVTTIDSKYMPSSVLTTGTVIVYDADWNQYTLHAKPDGTVYASLMD